MVNNFSIIKERKKEVIDYIVANELNIATSRIMDFAKEFSSQEKINESIIYKQQYNAINEEIRQLGGKTLEDTRKLQRLSRSLLEFLDVIHEEYNQNINDTTIDKASVENINLVNQNICTEREKAKMIFLFNKNKIEDINGKILCKCEGVSKVYKNKEIGFQLHPIDIDIKIGEILALVGENGNGKTTLLNLIAGELQKTEGKIEYNFENKDKKINSYFQIKQDIAYIKQELSPWHGSLKDNLHYIASIKGIYGQQNIDEVEFIIHRLGLEKQISNKWNTLSGGYKMRFALAKALVWSPKLLILDEPLANLDMRSQEKFLRELKFLTQSQRNPISIIITTQQIYEVENIADKIIFLSNGKAKYNGYIQEFAKNRKYNTFELICNLDRKELELVLNEIEIKSIQVSSNSFIIQVSLDISEKYFLLHLFKSSQKIKIKYFRDISTSTRILFKDEK